jgi:hypothetical protein
MLFRSKKPPRRSKTPLDRGRLNDTPCHKLSVRSRVAVDVSRSKQYNGRDNVGARKAYFVLGYISWMLVELLTYKSFAYKRLST